MVDVVMDPERGLLQDGRTAQEFLEDLFEYEYLAECGGDTEDHIVVLDVFGLFHALCLSEASIFLSPQPCCTEVRWGRAVEAFPPRWRNQ